MNRHFFIQGRYCGAIPVEKTYRVGTLFIPRSYHYFCPVCACVWATAIVPDAGSCNEAINIPCPDHHGGNIQLPNLPEYNESFPDEVLAHLILLPQHRIF